MYKPKKEMEDLCNELEKIKPNSFDNFFKCSKIISKILSDSRKKEFLYHDCNAEKLINFATRCFYMCQDQMEDSNSKIECDDKKFLVTIVNVACVELVKKVENSYHEQKIPFRLLQRIINFYFACNQLDTARTYNDMILKKSEDNPLSVLFKYFILEEKEELIELKGFHTDENFKILISKIKNQADNVINFEDQILSNIVHLSFIESAILDDCITQDDLKLISKAVIKIIFTDNYDLNYQIMDHIKNFLQKYLNENDVIINIIQASLFFIEANYGLAKKTLDKILLKGKNIKLVKELENTIRKYRAIIEKIEAK